MFWYIIILIVAAFLFWVWRKPSQFELSRSIDIDAAPATIHPHINTLAAMNQWNPWATYNPKSVIAYEGPASGPGAIYTWSGSKMGEGRFMITESTPLEIKAVLTMIKPMKADNKVTFSLAPSGSGTRVTWSMAGTSSFVHKLMHTVINMDKMVGTEFEKGLAGLKAAVESKKLS